MKKFYIILSAVVLGVGVGVWYGWYPVASVNGGLISARTWRVLIAASQRYAENELVQYGKQPINFDAPENRELSDRGKKEMLTALIEDHVIATAGSAMASDFTSRVAGKTADALRRNSNIEEQVHELYGVSLDEFTRLIVIPQARRDVVQEELVSAGNTISFDQWLRTAKQNAHIHVWFASFHWNGDQIE